MALWRGGRGEGRGEGGYPHTQAFHTTVEKKRFFPWLQKKVVWEGLGMRLGGGGGGGGGDSSYV